MLKAKFSIKLNADDTYEAELEGKPIDMCKALLSLAIEDKKVAKIIKVTARAYDDYIQSQSKPTVQNEKSTRRKNQSDANGSHNRQ